MNEFINWSPERHYNIVRVDLDDRVMWIPDIIFFTQLTGEHFNAEFPAPPAILFDGLMMVLKPFKAEIVCIMDVWYFPFDKQVSYGYNYIALYLDYDILTSMLL